MIENNPTNVQAAFEMLLEEIEAETRRAQTSLREKEGVRSCPDTRGTTPGSSM